MSNATTVHRDNLALSLSVHTSGSTVTAEAQLTNRGTQPWEYAAGGDLPPVPEIRAREEGGREVYGWKHGIAAHWMRIRELQPGASLEQRAEFTAQGAIYVRASAPGGRSGQSSLQTDEIKVELPGSPRPDRTSA